MTNERKKETLQCVLDNFDIIGTCGICTKTYFVYANKLIKGITFSEVNTVIKFVRDNRPKWYNSKFWWNSAYRRFNDGSGFWWNGPYAATQRKLFLQHLINKL